MLRLSIAPVRSHVNVIEQGPSLIGPYAEMASADAPIVAIPIAGPDLSGPGRGTSSQTCRGKGSAEGCAPNV